MVRPLRGMPFLGMVSPLFSKGQHNAENPQVGRLLSANGMESTYLQLGELENTPATVALLEGRIDGLVFSSAPDAPLIQMLLQTPGIKLFDFEQSEAYARRLPFLSHVVLPRGIVDLGRDLPSKDYHLIAPTATLVAREGLHPALVDLFVQAAADIHGNAGWFSKQGDFPTANYTEIPVAPRGGADDRGCVAGKEIQHVSGAT